MIAKKREEEANKLKKELEERMESHIENREAHINSLKERVKDHVSSMSLHLLKFENYVTSIDVIVADFS